MAIIKFVVLCYTAIKKLTTPCLLPLCEETLPTSCLYMLVPVQGSKDTKIS